MNKRSINTCAKLEDFLEEKYGSRFEPDYFSSMNNNVCGTLDSKKFFIKFKAGEYLLVITLPSTSEVLDELLPALTEVMGNQKPICSYDLQSNGVDLKNAKPTIEWELVDPENRLKEIVNGRAFPNTAKTHNVKVLNGKNYSDYLENNNMDGNRIYGIDSGCIKDVCKINNLSEVDLFFMICAMTHHMWKTKRDMANGRIPKTDLIEEQYALEYMVYQTTKFGVELATPEIDKHIKATPSFIAWFDFYSNHFQNLSSNEFYAFQKAHANGQDTSLFMPSGNWNDSLEQPPQKKLENNE